MLVGEVAAVLYSGQCAILLDNTVLLTGGSSGSGELDYVTEYSTAGLVVEWPRLREARSDHGCGRVGQVSAILYSLNVVLV